MASAMLRACSVELFPGDQDIGAERRRRNWGARSATGRPLSNKADSSVIMDGLCHSSPGRPDDHVEDAAVAADEIVTARRVVKARPRQCGLALAGAGGDVVALHEGAEQHFGWRTISASFSLDRDHGQPLSGPSDEIATPGGAESPRCSCRIFAQEQRGIQGPYHGGAVLSEREWFFMAAPNKKKKKKKNAPDAVGTAVEFSLERRPTGS